MLKAKDKHDRHITVCAENDCTKCDSTEPYIPCDCPFKILHLLVREQALNDGKMIYKGRRTGKTTEILRQARIRSKRGEKVLVLCHHPGEAKRIGGILEREAKGEPIEVMTASKATQGNNLRGRHKVSVLADEVNAPELESILDQLRDGQFKGGMATPT